MNLFKRKNSTNLVSIPAHFTFTKHCVFTISAKEIETMKILWCTMYNYHIMCICISVEAERQHKTHAQFHYDAGANKNIYGSNKYAIGIDYKLRLHKHCATQSFIVIFRSFSDRWNKLKPRRHDVLVATNAIGNASMELWIDRVSTSPTKLRQQKRKKTRKNIFSIKTHSAKRNPRIPYIP